MPALSLLTYEFWCALFFYLAGTLICLAAEQKVLARSVSFCTIRRDAHSLRLMLVKDVCAGLPGFALHYFIDHELMISVRYMASGVDLNKQGLAGCMQSCSYVAVLHVPEAVEIFTTS